MLCSGLVRAAILLISAAASGCLGHEQHPMIEMDPVLADKGNLFLNGISRYSLNTES